MDERETVKQTFQNLLKMSGDPIVNFPILNQLPFPSVLYARSEFSRLHSIADRVVLARRDYLRNNPDSPADSFLDQLIRARDTDTDRCLSNVEVRDNIITFLAAGSETTATAMSWVLYYLAVEPEVYAKVEAELASVHVEPNDTKESPTESHHPYLLQVINESMRIRSPVNGLVPRFVPEPLEVGGAYFPSGSSVICSMIAMHLNPKNFESPEDFRPERFDKGLPSAFIPFGLGRRMCIGRSLAYLEMKVVLPLLLEHFQVELDTSKPVIPKISIPVLAPQGFHVFCKEKTKE